MAINKNGEGKNWSKKVQNAVQGTTITSDLSTFFRKEKIRIGTFSVTGIYCEMLDTQGCQGFFGRFPPPFLIS